MSESFPNEEQVGGEGGAEQAEIAARLEAFAKNAQEIKEAMVGAQSVEDVLVAVGGAVETAPQVLLSVEEKPMLSLSENGDPSVKMVEYDAVLVALNELRERELAAIAVDSEYAYADAVLDDYRDTVPGYILDRIAELPRFKRPE